MICSYLFTPYRSLVHGAQGPLTQQVKGKGGRGREQMMGQVMGQVMGEG